jgi:hypothetical protein
MPLHKTVFILEDFMVGAPGQQLLDRFLIGYSRDGEFRHNPGGAVGVWLASAPEESKVSAGKMSWLAQRQRDFNLVQHASFDAALRDAESVIVVGAAGHICPAPQLVEAVVQQAPINSACFVYGCLATRLVDAERLLALASKRNVAVTSASSIATTFRLPEVKVPVTSAISEALVVVNGMKPFAELTGIDALAAMLARDRGDESSIRSVRGLEGRRLWRAAEEGAWSEVLLAAAISRSNTTQGDALRDGRTQDLVGLGLVKKLARNPRGWIVEQRNGTRAAILVLNGVVADVNFAVRAGEGRFYAAQLYRPPAPVGAEFDPLAAAIENFLTTRISPWSKERALLVSQFMEAVTG